MISPRAIEKPASTAACWPALYARSTSVTRGSDAWIPSRSSAERSIDPSFTKTISLDLGSASRTAPRRRWSSGKLPSSLKSGTTTLSHGPAGPWSASARAWGPRDHSDDVVLAPVPGGGERGQRGAPARGFGREGRVGVDAAEFLAIVREPVNRREVQAHVDTRRLQLGHEPVTVHGQPFGGGPDDIQMMRVAMRVGHAAEGADLRNVGEGPVAAPRGARARRGGEAVGLASRRTRSAA